MDFDHSREERRGTRAPLLIFEHRRFLKVERSATLRSGQKMFKIWNHGVEYRAVDTPQLDKY